MDTAYSKKGIFASLHRVVLSLCVPARVQPGSCMCTEDICLLGGWRPVCSAFINGGVSE